MTKVFALETSGHLAIFDEADGYAPMPVAYDKDGNVIDSVRHPAIPAGAFELTVDDVLIVRGSEGPFVYHEGKVAPFAAVPEWQPDQPLPQEALVAYAAEKRWQVENAGITVGGVLVATDDRSKIMIIGARVKADRDPDFTTQWKAASGEFITVDSETIVTISDAVLDHIDACFAAEQTVLAAIEAGTIGDRAAIDATDWPG